MNRPPYPGEYLRTSLLERQAEIVASLCVEITSPSRNALPAYMELIAESPKLVVTRLS